MKKEIKEQKITLNLLMGSDLHNLEFPEIKLNVDVLIFAGDFTNCDAIDYLSQYSQFDNSMKDLLSKSIGKVKVAIIVFGNHCTFADYNPRHKMITKWIDTFKENGIELHFLTNEMINYKGVTFYGSPYNRPVSNREGYVSPWAFHWNEKRIKSTSRYLGQVKPHVMITHAPPLGHVDINHKGEHVGCERWFEFLGDYRPDLWVSGHIHESRGIEIDGKTTYVNAALDTSHHYKVQKKNDWVYFSKEFDLSREISKIEFEWNGDTYIQDYETKELFINGQEVDKKESFKFWEVYKEYKKNLK